MKAKRVCAAVLSGVMVCGMLGFLPTASMTGSDTVQSVLESLSLDYEPMTVCAADGVMRRPVSNESPMWLVHIESWNMPDPEKSS